MALSETVKDKLNVLCVMANALASICETAVANADGDSAEDDVMVNATRRQFLTLKSIGGDFLTVSGTPAVRKSFATLNSSVADLVDHEGRDDITERKWKDLVFSFGGSIAEFQTSWNNAPAL